MAEVSSAHVANDRAVSAHNREQIFRRYLFCEDVGDGAVSSTDPFDEYGIGRALSKVWQSLALTYPRARAILRELCARYPSPVVWCEAGFWAFSFCTNLSQRGSYVYYGTTDLVSWRSSFDSGRPIPQNPSAILQKCKEKPYGIY